MVLQYAFLFLYLLLSEIAGALLQYVKILQCHAVSPPPRYIQASWAASSSPFGENTGEQGLLLWCMSFPCNHIYKVLGWVALLFHKSILCLPPAGTQGAFSCWFNPHLRFIKLFVLPVCNSAEVNPSDTTDRSAVFALAVNLIISSQALILNKSYGLFFLPFFFFFFFI